MDFSIIIVNWNSCDFLKNCLKSVATRSQAKNYKFEVIVIDNASRDCNCRDIKRQFPWVSFIFNNKNIGFTRAVNQGIIQSCGEFVVLLNPDTVIMNDILEGFHQIFSKHKGIGIIGPKLITKDNKLQSWVRGDILSIQSAINYYFLPFLLFLGIPFVKSIVDNRNYQDITEMGWISGACLAIRRKILDQVDLLDNSFFMYSEDMDICCRVKNAGYRVVYAPWIIVKHFIGQSLKKQTSQNIMDAPLISQDEYYQKLYGQKGLLFFRYIVFWGSAIRLIIKLLVWIFNSNCINENRFQESIKNVRVALKLLKKKGKS